MSSTVVTMFLVDLALLACFMFMPVMRGEDAFFGVRVDAETYAGEGRRVLRRYWFWLVMTFLQVEAIGFVVSYFKGRAEFAAVAPRLLLLPLAALLYVIFYRQVKPLERVEEGQRFASSLRARRLKDYTSLALEVLVVLMTIVPVVLLVYYYPQLPERIPVHWNWKGEPDAWARKSYYTVFSLAATLVYIQGLILLIKHGLLGVKMTLPAEHTEEYLRLKEQSLGLTLRFMDWMRLLLCLMMGGLAANVALASVEHLRPLSKVIAVAAGVAGWVMIASALYITYHFYMTDRRLKAEAGRVYVQRQRDAEHWYLGGLVYFNREDPALWVEKLVGWGYTFNLGNKWGYLYLAVIVGVPLVLFLPLER
ncbi:MAG TPA: DUF1648 domain-containing protein [Pyrinomonadaceae bacterium]|nr:DUF1648 domain-containing protein [Pyrinomonadaceae bacterium]